MWRSERVAAGQTHCFSRPVIVTAVPALEPIFEPVIEKAGFNLVRLRMMGGSDRTLQVMAERPDGTMDVEGCTALSHALLEFIETEDPIEGEYEIEVSSPGIDRPLTRPMDFTRWSGHEAKIELTAPVATAAGERKRFRALLLGLDGADVVIRDTSIGIADIKFPFRNVANAKLVLTDKLINENLKTRESAQQEK
ncbi:MAG TPA: ribosome maturation factor RimP [Rhizomicrobium sp.]|nr:ribosome maturation factor RimP [Rhizomicrobium sp.]